METQNNINNGLTPNQQPQPQKEEEKKKKNKFVAWWLGLNKWAKVGICAGAAAVLATAITLPIVLSKSGIKEGPTYTMDRNSQEYQSESINLEPNTRYTFKLTVDGSWAPHSFCIRNDNMENVDIKSITLSGVSVAHNWVWHSDEKKFNPDEEAPITEGTAVFKVVLSSAVSNVRAIAEAGQ